MRRMPRLWWQQRAAHWAGQWAGARVLTEEQGWGKISGRWGESFAGCSRRGHQERAQWAGSGGGARFWGEKQG